MKSLYINTLNILMLLLFLLTAMPVNAQDSTEAITDDSRLPPSLLEKISLKLDSVPFREALNRLANIAGLHLNYSENIIPQDIKVTLDAVNKPAVVILGQILKNTPVDFVITKGNQIVLVKRKISGQAYSRDIFTISGYVNDSRSGETLVGTNIYINELNTGGTTNAYGFYSITIPEGYYTIKLSYVGYNSKEFFIILNKDINLNVELSTSSFAVDTVVVTSTIERDFVNSTEMGTIVLNPGKLSSTPYLLGEQDILKTMHLLPGVTFGREGDAGFYVRGGEFDQNLTLLDEAPVYSNFHSFGFFSVFNPDAIRNIKLIKGAAPPKYGGRLSSVLDIQMSEGNMKEYGGVAGIGLIFSRFTLEGPLIRDKSSFIVSARRTYLDGFKLFTSEIDDVDFYFYDLNGKVNYKIDNSDRLYLSLYLGSDVLGVTKDFQMSWGNNTGTLRWNHLFNDKFFLNTSMIYSRYKHETVVGGDNASDDEVTILSNVEDITLKQDYEYFKDTENTFSFGLNYIYHSFLPGQITIEGDTDFNFVIGKRNAHELSLYASHEYKFDDALTIDYGFRSTLFSVKGEKDRFDIEDATDAPLVEFHEDEAANYLRLEPRLTFTYQLNNVSSVKTGFAINHQYLHMLSNAISGTPLDVWQPSSARVKPQQSQQISLGYFRDFEQGAYEMSIEGYYKDLYNVIDLRDGANLVLKNYFESELVFGRGWAYGLEFHLKKQTGNFTGWIGYTIAKSERKIKEINNGRPYPSKYDRTHDFSIVAAYKISPAWSLSANWVYCSGYNTTLPYGSYSVDNKNIEVFTDRNSYRLPAYHRLDVGISYTNSLGGTWNFSLYNAYGHKNIYMISIRESENRFKEKEAVAYSLFSLVPSISYTLRF